MMKIAIVIGHNKVKQGYFSPYIGMTEYNYHKRVVSLLKGVDIYYRNDENYYSKEIESLCDKLNSKSYDLVLSLHFNSFNGSVQGSEAWVFHSNEFTKNVAFKFSTEISNQFNIKDRGVKLINNINQRGGMLFYKCKHPVVLLEPFFGDEIESKKFKDYRIYADFLQCFINDLK